MENWKIRRLNSQMHMRVASQKLGFEDFEDFGKSLEKHFRLERPDFLFQAGA
jgi:hypothetical protein